MEQIQRIIPLTLFCFYIIRSARTQPDPVGAAGFSVGALVSKIVKEQSLTRKAEIALCSAYILSPHTSFIGAACFANAGFDVFNQIVQKKNPEGKFAKILAKIFHVKNIARSKADKLGRYAFDSVKEVFNYYSPRGLEPPAFCVTVSVEGRKSRKRQRKPQLSKSQQKQCETFAATKNDPQTQAAVNAIDSALAGALGGSTGSLGGITTLDPKISDLTGGRDFGGLENIKFSTAISVGDLLVGEEESQPYYYEEDSHRTPVPGRGGPPRQTNGQGRPRPSTGQGGRGGVGS